MCHDSKRLVSDRNKVPTCVKVFNLVSVNKSLLNA